MLKIDSGHMFSAINDLTDGPSGCGFIHRRTGEILFVNDDDVDESTWYGKDVAINNVFERAVVEASPEQWVEIPRYDRCMMGRDREEEFIRDFLEENGIAAELD